MKKDFIIATKKISALGSFAGKSNTFSAEEIADLKKQPFTKTIGQAARSAHKRLRQVEYRTQAPDHPILWASDESYYLKFYIFQVCDEK